MLLRVIDEVVDLKIEEVKHDLRLKLRNLATQAFDTLKTYVIQVRLPAPPPPLPQPLHLRGVGCSVPPPAGHLGLTPAWSGIRPRCWC